MDQIERAMNHVCKSEGLPWSGKVLHKSLRYYLSEFEAAAMLVQQVVRLAIVKCIVEVYDGRIWVEPAGK